MTRPFFSIVTISFNQGKYLERCIKSIINQNFDSFEYILVDALSTDNSRDIINKYKTKIDKIIIEKDLGPADGLNKGFKLATGKYYYYLNADDEIFDGSLEKIYYDINFNNSFDVYLYDGVKIDSKGKILDYLCSTKVNKSLFLANVTSIIQQGTFFSSNLFKKTEGFNIENKINWDTELICDFLLINAKFRTTRLLVGKFRFYSGTISYSDKIAIESKKNREQMEKKLQNKKNLIIFIFSFILKPYKHILKLKWILKI